MQQNAWSDILKDKNRSPKNWLFSVAAITHILSDLMLSWLHPQCTLNSQQNCFVIHTYKNNAFKSVFKTNTYSVNQASALRTFMYISVWAKAAHVYYREERQERNSLVSAGPIWIPSSGSQRRVCLLRCLENAQVVDMQGDRAALQLACFGVN